LKVEEISPQQYLDRRATGAALALLDVREAWELDIAALAESFSVKHIPMGQIADRLGELDAQSPTVVMCRSGARSGQVALFLASQGFRSVYNLAGGILAWSRDIDPTIPVY
jgi:rhodanese-related sulfurtransferase